MDPITYATPCLVPQDTASAPALAGLVQVFNSSSLGESFPTPPIAPFVPHGGAFQSGFSVEFWLGSWNQDERDVAPGQALLDVRSHAGAGFVVNTTEALGNHSLMTLSLSLCDDVGTSANLTLDSACASLLGDSASSHHHVMFTVDASAHIALAVVDGFLCDGGTNKLRGWTWLPADLTTVHPAPTFIWGGNYGGALLGGRWYNRALSVTDAVGNARAGPPLQK